ncbi:MAG TPA: phosphatidylglycerol lysyltransferase domain-containing protein [Pseudonocardiaceae bacterium]|jgi:lysyl-tRNA synthetase class 2|nr:phosphatidylglycerol lysyltransferase domain-containing protein [Pseudonocardiaceae bacterium]
MTATSSHSQATKGWQDRGNLTVRLICWSTRLVGLLTLGEVIFLNHRKPRHPMTLWFDLPVEATVAAVAVAVAAGVGLLLLATGLRRRKRRAWQIAVLTTAVITVLSIFFHHGPAASITALALLIALVLKRREFAALPDPSMGKWRAIAVFVEMLVGGVVVNYLILLFNHRDLLGRPGSIPMLEHAALTLVGIEGPINFRSEFLDDATATLGLVFGIGAVLIGGYFLLRSAEPRPGLSFTDESRIRDLLTAHGSQDSLGYFTLRRDKSVVFSPSGKSAVAYRVLAGVALTSGDPLGDIEAWPGAIEEYLAACWRHGWVPAVLGCSERAATVWDRHGLTVLELGDEAVVDVPTFSTQGRKMRGVRQTIAKVGRAGYTARVRRAKDISDAEHTELATLADYWRGTETERGFSMALSRLADSADPECVLVTAEQDGQVRGMLQFVPWGTDGLSLDLMRRDRDADNGLNEFMITELLANCADLGVRNVSLNFAMFRAALERGERIGAGPIARLWARALRLGSHWWQIESLYRFNAKFRPLWVPRYLVFPAVRDLPRIALAAMEAEGFGGRPPALLRMLRRN